MLALNKANNPTYKWALTGTPISKRLEQLYCILYWVDRGFLPPWPKFEKTHIIRDHFKRISGYKNLNSLHEYLKNRVSRKGHKDLEGKLPKILPKVYKYPKSKQYDKAETVLIDLLDKAVENLSFDKDGNPIFKRDRKTAKTFKEAELRVLEAKQKYILDYLSKTITNETKVVVFCRLKEPLYDLHKVLEEKGIPCFKFTGDESGDEKQNNVSRFREHSSAVLLCSNAGARGLDLPFATHVVNLDVPTSHGTNSQRIKRAVRIASNQRSIVASYLVIEDSLEEYYFNQMLREGELHSAVTEGTKDAVKMKDKSLRQFLHERRTK